MAFIIHWNWEKHKNILKGFNVVRRDRTQANRLSGGVAIVLRNGIAARENTGAPTYCSPSTGAMSCLDLALCTPSLLIDFKWSVINNPYGSDHMPGIIKNTSPFPTVPLRPPRWKLHLADWPLFSEKASLDHISDDQTIDEMNEKIIASILAAAEQTIPSTFTSNVEKEYAIELIAHGETYTLPCDKDEGNE
ncbi:uncharacterized protein [Dermacentor andersoni]|uniref:uncharacterized protein n=1 Tax=Dermacentor andersoni TaxID=34620 RepID=UPI003B3AFD0A